MAKKIDVSTMGENLLRDYQYLTMFKNNNTTGLIPAATTEFRRQPILDDMSKFQCSFDSY